MKISEGYILRKIADTHFAVSVRPADAGRMIRLNETGALLWQALEKGADTPALISLLMAEYEVDEATASADVTRFLDSLDGIIEE